MIVASPALARAMLTGPGLVAALGTSATVAIFDSSRPEAAGDAPAGPAQTIVVLAATVGIWDDASARLVLAQSAEGQLVSGGAPEWARAYATDGAWMFDCDARLDGAADNGEELVVAAPALYPGAFVRISGGTLRI